MVAGWDPGKMCCGVDMVPLGTAVIGNATVAIGGLSMAGVGCAEKLA